MLDLSETALKNWLGALPSDVRGVIQAGDPARVSDILCQKVAASSPSEMIALFSGDATSALALGRIGRMRFLAWLLGRALPREDWVQAINTLTGETEDGEDGAQTARPSDATMLFLADMQSFNEHVVAPRLANRMVAADILALAADASAVLETEVQLTRGGSV